MKKPETKLNPDIRKVEVGIRELKEVTLYPLSAGFQMTFMSEVSDVLVQIFDTKLSELNDQQLGKKIATMFMNEFQKHIKSILEESAGTPQLQEVGYIDIDEFLNDISTNQFVEMSDHLYKANYEAIVKKIEGFLKNKSLKDQMEMAKIRKVLDTSDASPSSVDTMEPTKSKTSTPHTGTEG